MRASQNVKQHGEVISRGMNKSAGRTGTSSLMVWICCPFTCQRTEVFSEAVLNLRPY